VGFLLGQTLFQPPACSLRLPGTKDAYPRPPDERISNDNPPLKVHFNFVIRDPTLISHQITVHHTRGGGSDGDLPAALVDNGNII